MRGRYTGVGVLCAVATTMTLTACGGAAAPVTGAPVSSAATTTATTAESGAGPAARCTAAELGVRLGEKGPETSPGQETVALVFTNTSGRACVASGVPGVDLQGPPDPNGPTYSVPRPGAGAAQRSYTLDPGASATATLTYLTDTPGSIGSQGSTGWKPTQVVTTPPGDTAQLTAAWTLGDTVLRQDEATHPGTFVGPLTAVR